MIIPFGFLKQPVSGVASLFDGVSVMYSLRTPDMGTLWTNAVLKIRRDSDNATAFLFVDGSAKDDTITLSGFISTTSDTTPSGTSLSTWLGSNGGWVERWYGITDDNTIATGKRAIQTTLSSQPQFANSSGVIKTKNGKPEIDFLTTTRSLVASANTDMASGNTFTTISVSNNDNATATNAVMSSSNTTNRSFSQFIDGGAAKNATRITNSVPTNFNCFLLAQNNTADQRELVSIITSTTLECYQNNIVQSTGDTWSGSYTNDAITIGVRRDTLQPHNGGIQEIIIFPSDKTSDLTTLHNEIDGYYSIP